MARRQNTRFSIYDAMEANGVFDENPANASSPNYKKQEYPKMFYHPLGKERVVVPPEIIVTPMGPKEVNEQRELITAAAADAAEEARLRAAGWHDHPAKANAAAGRGAAPQGASDRIAELEAEIRRLTAEKGVVVAGLNSAQARAPASGPLSVDDALASGADEPAKVEA